MHLVAWFARIDSHDSCKSGDARESEIRVIQANRLTRYKNRGFNCEWFARIDLRESRCESPMPLRSYRIFHQLAFTMRNLPLDLPAEPQRFRGMLGRRGGARTCVLRTSFFSSQLKNPGQVWFPSSSFHTDTISRKSKTLGFSRLATRVIGALQTQSGIMNPEWVPGASRPWRLKKFKGSWKLTQIDDFNHFDRLQLCFGTFWTMGPRGPGDSYRFLLWHFGPEGPRWPL